MFITDAEAIVCGLTHGHLCVTSPFWNEAQMVREVASKISDVAVNKLRGALGVAASIAGLIAYD